MSKLLSREEFKNQVFKRSDNFCVCCKNNNKSTKAIDAHHIIDRSLWDDGGYYLDNGVALCSDCHDLAEITLISPKDLRLMAGIKNVVLPDSLDIEEEYDKWGNIVLNNKRLAGPLFYQENVQKSLKRGGVLNLFTSFVKYPRTKHLPWSRSKTSDDKVMNKTSIYHGLEVVVTEKMDGENTTLYKDYIHARSIDSVNHPSRNWVKAFHGSIKHDIPENWRICGENCFALHSIKYENLESYFLGFSVWNERNECLSWDDSLQWFDLLGIKPVRELYRGIYDEKIIKSLWKEDLNESMEGYVIRPASSFPMKDFSRVVGKFVRPKHVQTNKHWMNQQITPNKLKIKC